MHSMCLEIGGMTLSIFIHSYVPSRIDKVLGWQLCYQLDNLLISNSNATTTNSATNSTPTTTTSAL